MQLMKSRKRIFAYFTYINFTLPDLNITHFFQFIAGYFIDEWYSVANSHQSALRTKRTTSCPVSTHCKHRMIQGKVTWEDEGFLRLEHFFNLRSYNNSLAKITFLRTFLILVLNSLLNVWLSHANLWMGKSKQ